MNFHNAMNLIQQLQNPQQLLQRMGIPSEYMNSPQNVAQYLLDNGKVTREQIQQANSMYQQMFNGGARR